jgi:hypothetical protein
MSQFCNARKDLMEVDFRPASKRVLDVLPIECDNLHGQSTESAFLTDDTDGDRCVERKLSAKRHLSDAFPKPCDETADLGIQRKSDTNLLENLSSDSIEEAWIHPFTIAANKDQPVIPENALEFVD